MIKIPTYNEHKKGKIILDRYLYIMALILPFAPKEILDTEILLVNGKEISADNFEKMARKMPRRRSSKYIDILKKYSIIETNEDKQQQFKNDQLLAARIIYEANNSLYKYLYDVKSPYIYPITTPLLNRKNLRTLLTSKMDELSPELCKIGTITKSGSEELLRYVFCYESFLDNKETINLCMDMDVTVCPYCNRLYTFTVKTSKRTTRPQFDHYFSKKKYPYFAVSLLNLIPCCGLCNQFKSDKEKKVLYPYSDEFGNDVVFYTESKSRRNKFDYLMGDLDAKNDFEVVFKKAGHICGTEFEKRVDNSIEIFRLLELYNGHKDYILHLFWMEQIFTETYIDSLSKLFPQMFPTKEDVKSWIYLMETDKANWGKSSLCKLTHDIDAEKF